MTVEAQRTASFLLTKLRLALRKMEPELVKEWEAAIDTPPREPADTPERRAAFALMGQARALCRLVNDSAASTHDILKLSRPLAADLDEFFRLTGVDDDDQQERPEGR